MDVTPIIIKKRKAHAHAHHGGSWKVAYADFVTAMMAFFMVMWIMGLSDKTKAQIQGYFNDPIGFAKNQPRSKTVIPIKGSPDHKHGESNQAQNQPYHAEHEQAKKLQKELESKMKSDPRLLKFRTHIEIKVTDDGLRIEFLEDKDSFFESGNDVLTPGAVKVIKILGPELAGTDRPIIVEGHTDSVPFAGDPNRNFKLSSDRASSLLVALGATGCKKFLQSTGFADRELRDPAHPTSAVNRRVTVLLPFVTPPTATIQMPKDEIRDKLHGAVVGKINFQPSAPNLVNKN